jgi:hypothetical protein
VLDEHLILPSYLVSHITHVAVSLLAEEWPKEVKNDLPLLVAGAMRDFKRGIESLYHASLVSASQVFEEYLPIG